MPDTLDLAFGVVLYQYHVKPKMMVKLELFLNTVSEISAKKWK